MKMKIGIPLSDHERNEIFEADPVAMQRGREALELVRAGKITGQRFLRLMDNAKGQALARFAAQCAEVAQNRLNAGWGAINARYAGGAR